MTLKPIAKMGAANYYGWKTVLLRHGQALIKSGMKASVRRSLKAPSMLLWCYGKASTQAQIYKIAV